ncbi:hypothetical protein [Lacihabitans lacunae]|jgi:hypothetical protein|uniref:Uncharacterized protein n=1 Tax=Lacihabitans lacunae TaxID=1028214 RepID=A0ABV7YZ88_9BACT
MENEPKTCTNQAVAELFQLEINSSDTRQFVDKSEVVHDFFSTLEGYTGMDLLFLSGEKMMILIRFSSYKLFDKNLSSILNACPIKDWFGNVKSIMHQPAMLKAFTVK